MSVFGLIKGQVCFTRAKALISYSFVSLSIDAKEATPNIHEVWCIIYPFTKKWGALTC